MAIKLLNLLTTVKFVLTLQMKNPNTFAISAILPFQLCIATLNILYICSSLSVQGTLMY